MEQDRVINKVLRDLVAAGLVSDKWKGEVRIELNRVYAAAWEESRKATYGHGNKPIGQYDEAGKLLNIYRSQIEAARKTGFTQGGILKAMQRGTATKQGWLWKYL
jgi:hypothetical protein